MASTIPAVLDHLMESWAVALPGVQLVEGQPLAPEPDIVCLAFTGLPGEPAIEAAEDRGQMAASPDRERYDIACLASAQRGETDARAVRMRAFELVDMVQGELRRDPTLGGLVLSARLAVISLVAAQTSGGAECTALFRVRIDAFTR
ncbi:hypothetical protein ACWEU6_21825 [Streptosporangium sandarakinum]